MLKIARNILILLICCGPLLVIGQNKKAPADSSSDYYNPNYQLKKPKKLHFSMEAGTTAGTAFGTKGSAFGTYVAPHFSYQFTPRFALNTGMMFVNSSYSNMPLYNPFDGNAFLYSGSQQYALLYAQGKYKLSDRLQLSGTAYYRLNKMSSPAYPGAYGQNGKSFSIGMDYKVSEHLHFQAAIQTSQGMSPFEQNMFTPGGFCSPLAPW